MRDLYKILGISADSDATIVKKRYRELAHKYHPDKNPDEKAKAKFQDIAMAYAVLGDEKRRAVYDRQWARPPSSAPGNLFGREFEDIIERVAKEGIRPDNIGEIFDEMIGFAENFQKVSPMRVREAADRFEEENPSGNIFGAFEALFNVLDKKKTGTPRVKKPK